MTFLAVLIAQFVGFPGILGVCCGLGADTAKQSIALAVVAVFFVFIARSLAMPDGSGVGYFAALVATFIAAFVAFQVKRIVRSKPN